MSPAWQPNYTKNDFEIKKQETLYSGFFKMLKVHLRHRSFAGDWVEIQRELFYREDAVCVLLYDAKRQQVVLVEQFRVGAMDSQSPWMLELVAGIVEQGESTEDVARREATEEAGAVLGEIKTIMRFVPSSGATREYIDLLCAQVDSEVISGIHGLEEEGEDIKVHCLSAADAFSLVETGIINNSPAIIALQWLQLHQQELDRCWAG